MPTASRRQNWPEGMVDTHVHSAPDVVPRLMNDIELARAADAAGYRAIVLKSHHHVTAPRATIAQLHVQHLEVFGGAVLNYHATGGLNPLAVRTALELGAKVIWLPTIAAANQLHYAATVGIKSRNLRRLGTIAGDGISVLDEQGHIVRPMIEILDAIAEAGATLATGHISSREIMVIVPEARRRGVPNVLLTHPEMLCIGLGLEDQLKLSEIDGVWFERVFALTMPTSDHVPVEVIAENIRTVGVDSTVMATDFGQAHNASPIEGLRQYIVALREAGFTQDEIEMMTVHNPSAALSLDKTGDRRQGS